MRVLGEVVNAIVESGPFIDVDAYAHNEFPPELAVSSVYNEISRYLFAIFLIKDDIEHETVDFNVVTSNEPSEPLVLITVLWSFQSIHLLISHLSSLS